MPDLTGRSDGTFGPAEPVQRALEELAYFSRELKVLGTYRAHRYRLEHGGR